MQKPFSLTTPGEPTIINKPVLYPGENQELKIEKENKTARLEFNTEDMKRFIDDRGILILWERGYFCTCLNPETGSPRIDCPKCGGKGIAYLPPLETTMIIQSQEKGANNLDLGLLDTGTAIGTTQLETRISYRDRITVPNVLMPQSLIFHMTKSRIDKGIPLYYDVKEVTFITSQDKVLSEDEYEIRNGRLFVDSSFEGKTISLNIYMVLRYVVSDILKESRYQYTKFNKAQTEFENLPQKVLLKREDVIVTPEPFKINDGMVENIEMQIEDPKSTPNSNLGGFFGGALN